MVCRGSCGVQIYDVDISDLKLKSVLVIDAKTGLPVDLPVGACPVLTPEEIADAMRPPYLKEYGCDDENCFCSIVQTEIPWSEWLTYFPSQITREYPGVDGRSCVYSFKGTYMVSSAQASGICMDQPDLPPPRHHSDKPKPEKAPPAKPEPRPKPQPQPRPNDVSRRRSIGGAGTRNQKS